MASRRRTTGKVVDHCYLCDLCYMTKCPYVPPHEWNLDFPHLMLRAKAVHYQNGATKLRDKVLTSTDLVGTLRRHSHRRPDRQCREQDRRGAQGVGWRGRHSRASLAARVLASKSLRSRFKVLSDTTPGEAAGRTTGKVALFATCYMNRNEPGPGEDLVAVFEHNGIPVTLAPRRSAAAACPSSNWATWKRCARAKEANIPVLAQAGRCRLGPHRADALLRADVQAGTAADVPRRSRRAEGEERLLRPLRVPDAAPQGRQAEDRLQAGARQGLATTPPATSACRTSARRPGSACRWCRTPRSTSSSAARATTAPTR